MEMEDKVLDEATVAVLRALHGVPELENKEPSQVVNVLMYVAFRVTYEAYGSEKAQSWLTAVEKIVGDLFPKPN